MTENRPRLTGACIGVCKFLRSGPRGQHCIGCSMTEAQKEGFKTLPDDPAREAYLHAIHVQQQSMGRYSHWPAAYREKCARKGAPLPVFLTPVA